MPRTRHFGASFPGTNGKAVADRLETSGLIVEQPTVSYTGEAHEQGKLMIRDPSGNLIEIKAYRHPDQVLGSLPHL